jgi:hypothetical protein
MEWLAVRVGIPFFVMPPKWRKKICWVSCPPLALKKINGRRK